MITKPKASGDKSVPADSFAGRAGSSSGESDQEAEYVSRESKKTGKDDRISGAQLERGDVRGSNLSGVHRLSGPQRRVLSLPENYRG